MSETAEQHILPEKTEIKPRFIDGETFASHLLELSRNIEEAKAEICEILRKKYETHELVEVDAEYFCEKLLNLTEIFQEIRNYAEKLPDRRKSLGGVEGRSATIEAKINRLELLLSCCNSLLPMDDEVEAMRTSHRSNAFGDVVERYNRFKDLGNNIFDSFLTDDEARKEFPIVETIDRKINMIAADAIVRLKKIFFGNIMWVKNSMETKLIIKCSEVEFIERWVEALESLEKFGCLEGLIAKFFDDLMTYFFQPIMSSSYADVTISSHELIIRQDPLQVTRSNEKAKPLWERICLLMSLLEFLFDKLKNPLEDKMKHLSLIEKLGSKGRGRAMFEFLISCLSPDGTDFELLTQEVRLQLVETFKLLLKDFANKKFIEAEDASNLALTLNSLTSEPGLYSSILHNASKLVHENLHFAVKVGRNIKNECEVEKVQDMADGPMMGFNDSPVCSKFQGVFETCEDLLPDLMKFKACCISLSGSRIVDLFYEAMGVKATDPLTQPFTGSLHNNTNICNATQNQTTSDASMLNATSRNFSILGHDSMTSSGKGRRSKSEPIMKKTSEEELARIYQCIRLVVELFVESMPAIHKRDIEGNALIAALHHNDCLYVSHHLLMLEHHMRPEEQRRKSKKGQAPPSSTTHSKLPLGLTFFDLHCDLKKLACSSLASFLARKQTELVDILKTSFNKRDVSENVENAYGRSMDALLEVKEHLFYLQKVWTGVLQRETLHKSLGALLNKVIHSVIEHCFNLALDFLPTRNTITTAKVSSTKCDAHDQGNARTESHRNLLSDFTRTCLNFISDEIALQMFDSSCPSQILHKNVSSWKKLQELRFITEPFLSQRRVTTRWCIRDGKKGGGFVVNRNIVGEVLTAPEARAFLSLAFSGSDLEKILKIFK